jgi:hypothetical protein
MPAGGAIGLSAYGGQNGPLSGNPQMSFYQGIFRQYTHFSSQTIAIPMTSSTLQRFDTSATYRVNIPNNGDLLSDLYLSMRMPPIYSKIYVPEGGDVDLDGVPYEFQWVSHLGARCIERAAIIICGQEIASVDGDWLFANRCLITGDVATGQKLDAMWGHVPELYDPASGMYAWLDVSGGRGYPTIRATTDAIQNNRFSIPETLLYIPLNFWFEKTQQALPIIALSGQEIEVVITLRPTRDWYTVIDVTSTDSPKPRIRPRNQPDMRPAAFFLDAGMGSAPTDSWDLRFGLEGTYVYLTTGERTALVQKPQNYLVRRIARLEFHGISSRKQLELDQQHGLATRIVWFARRPDAIAERNDWENMTNWVDMNVAPRLDGAGIATTLPNSGVNTLTSQRELIRGGKLIVNGEDFVQDKGADFYSKLQPYERCSGVGHPGLYTFSFELGHNAIQPMGTLNLSVLPIVRLDVDVYPPISGLTHTIYVYIETLNFLHVENGMGGLAFAT